MGFSICNKGYIGTGSDSTGLRNDFWEHNPVTNVWTQKANFAGTARSGTVGFSIGNRGYIGTGNDGSLKNDFWEYDPVNNVWAAKANFEELEKEAERRVWLRPEMPLSKMPRRITRFL